MVFIYVLLIACCGHFGKVTSNENGKKICLSEDFMRSMMRGNCKHSEHGQKHYYHFCDHNQRPVFFATLKTHPFILNGVNDVVKFVDVRINRGDGYNPNDGVFTAPRSGIYQISCMLIAEKSNLVQFTLMKNDSNYTYGHVGSHDSQTISAVLDLQKGDRVYIKHRVNGVQKIVGSSFSTFSGHFLQE